jgi:hypothetical protein
MLRHLRTLGCGMFSVAGINTVEPNRRLCLFSLPRNQVSARAGLISGVFT